MSPALFSYYNTSRGCTMIIKIKHSVINRRCSICESPIMRGDLFYSDTEDINKPVCSNCNREKDIAMEFKKGDINYEISS